ncbi:MAG: YiaA/YiaB family inner membrane protein [Pseudomonadota bacterium]
MQDPNIKHSSAWVNFTFFNFAVSVGMMSVGIFFLPLDLATKGFLTMATLMIISSSITVTKTMRDNQEAAKLVTKIEDAKTERLLMDINRGEAA